MLRIYEVDPEANSFMGSPEAVFEVTVKQPLGRDYVGRELFEDYFGSYRHIVRSVNPPNQDDCLGQNVGTRRQTLGAG